jgi:hypothetical protein
MAEGAQPDDLMGRRCLIGPEIGFCAPQLPRASDSADLRDSLHDMEAVAKSCPGVAVNLHTVGRTPHGSAPTRATDLLTVP